MKKSFYAARNALACSITLMLACACLPAWAIDVGGVPFDDSIRVANEVLRLNGAGISEGVGLYRRTLNKTMAIGLYLAERKATPADIIHAPGAKRIAITMLQDVSSEHVSRGFINGIQNNIDRSEKLKIAVQLMKLGEVLAATPVFQKGDVLYLDWLPTTSTTVSILNGKKTSELPDRAYFNALLQIFLGERPIDPKLRRVFLGEKLD